MVKKYIPSVAVWGLVLLSLLLFKLNALPLAILILFSALLTYVLFIKKTSKEKSLIFYIVYLIFFYGLLKHFSLSVDEGAWYYTALSRTANIIDSEFILILVTSLYVIFTYKMFTEMERSRILSQRPNVIARPEQEGEWSVVYLTITNIGSTPAFDVTVDYKLTKNDNTIEKYHWNNSVLQSMEKVTLVLAEHWILDFYKENKKLEVNMSYVDKEKTNFQESLIFDFKKLLSGLEKNRWALPKDREYEVAKSLGVLARESERIREYLKYISDEPKIKYNERKNKAIKEHIERVRKNKTRSAK